MLCSRLALLLALSPGGSVPRAGYQILRVWADAIGHSHAVARPHYVRCSPEGKVIGLKGHATARGFVEQDCEPQGAGLALADAAQEKALRNTAVEHGVDQQNVAASQTGLLFTGRRGGTAGEKHFAAWAAGQLDIAHVFADEVQRDRNANVANEVGGENEGSIHSYDYIQFSTVTGASDFAAHSLDAIRNASSRVSRYVRHRY